LKSKKSSKIEER